MAVREMTCYHCHGTGTSPYTGNSCHVCGGDGIMPVKDDHSMYAWLREATNARVEDLETKLDALQADMDIIKPQIDALYEDLNP